MDGVLLIDKPAGQDVARRRRRVRREHGGRKASKVGHAGTLDPFATGLLLVLARPRDADPALLMALPKRYEAVARFGAVSTTGDPEGEITETGAPRARPARAAAGEIAPAPAGVQRDQDRRRARVPAARGAGRRSRSRSGR